METPMPTRTCSGSRRRRAGRLAIVVLAAAFVLARCGDGRSPVEPPLSPEDGTAPEVHVVFPAGGAIDADGDGLVDVELAWSDDGGAVDVSGVTVRSVRGVSGSDADANLLDLWTVTRRDSAGLVLEEATAHLLRSGDQALVVHVPDTAGNASTDTIPLVVPPAAFHETLVPGVGGITMGIAVCPDEPRAYVTVGASMVTIDLEALQIAGVDSRLPGTDGVRDLCVAGDPMVYVSTNAFAYRFDRTLGQWAGEMPTTWPSREIIQSRADPNLLYTGELVRGQVGIIDRSRAERIGIVGLPPSTASSSDWVPDLAVLENDRKLYVPRFVERGIIVADPRTGDVIRRIDLYPDRPEENGIAERLALSPDDSRLYAIVYGFGIGRGIWEIDTATDAITRVMELPAASPRDFAVSPDGTYLFVVVQDPSLPQVSHPPHYLIDLRHWQVVQGLPRPTPEGEGRYDQVVAFDSSGRFVLAGHDGDIDVYLVRV
jgi:DNA-binding beta-propeller fold protein YncE